MIVRDELGARSVKPGGTAGCIYILSQQSEGQDFFVQTCSYFLTHTHQKEIGG